MSPNHKTKEEGLADSLGDQVIINDFGGKYVDRKEGKCEKPTWDTIIRPTTCHSPRGVESASNRDIRVVGTRNLTPETEFDSIIFPSALIEKKDVCCETLRPKRVKVSSTGAGTDPSNNHEETPCRGRAITGG